MNNLNSNLETLFDKMEGFVSTKTVIGEPVQMEDMTIIPLVDIAFGVGAGTSVSDETQNKKNKEGAAGGLGAKITPSAMMVIKNGNVQIINVNNSSPISKFIETVPGIVSDIATSFKKKDIDIDEDIIPDDERIVE